MGYPIYIAKRLSFSESTGNNSYILRFAVSGIALAIVVMMLSIAIVNGFRTQIISTIYSIDNHVKVTTLADYNTGEHAAVSYSYIENCIGNYDNITSIVPIIEKYSILKTDSDFQGIKLRGYNYSNNEFLLKNYLVEGRTPISSDSTLYEIVISETIKNKLGLNLNQKVSAYFIDEKVRMRNFNVVGIYNTNFEDFDNFIVFGNIDVLRQLNGWNDDECSYIGINMAETDDIREDSYMIYSQIYEKIISDGVSNGYSIENLYDNNMAYFAWLDLLDSNILLILTLMAFVVGFTIVAAMLVIVFDRVRTIGVLKSLGASNSNIRFVFVYLTQFLVLRGIIIGNLLGLILAWIQYEFHIIKLDPASYYMQWVPIKINFTDILILDVAVIAFAFITLIIASSIISRIKISTTIRYE